MQRPTIGKAACPDQGRSGSEHTKGLTQGLYPEFERAATKMASEGAPGKIPSAASPRKSLLGASPSALSHTSESVASSVGCDFECGNGRRVSGVAADGCGEREVTVCSACLRASCWRGVDVCHASGGARPVEMCPRALEALGREDAKWFGVGCGEVLNGIS